MADSKGPNSGGREIPYAVNNPEQLAQNMFKLLDVGGRALTLMLKEKRADGHAGVAGDMGEAGNMFASVMSRWLTEPEKFAVKQAKLAEDFVELWGRTNKRFLGEKVEPLAKPAPGDSRFRDPDWTENPFFDFCKQAYLLSVNWADDLVRDAEGVEDHTRRRAQFYLSQITSALSPSNFPLTNPEVLRMTLSTNAENLVRGMTQLVKDLDESGDLLTIKQTDLSAFAVGKNLATTPGKVVYQNQIMQLIQYQPTTPSVFALPIMIVPPWINKYYILDLVPQKSFIRWLVDQSFTVFVVSWINPGRELGHKSFENYMQEGILESLAVVQRLTEQAKTNVMGYCVGGTLLGSTLAYMAAIGDKRFNSASFLAAQVDFSQAGDLLVFIDDTQIKALEAMMAEHGYLDGARMATVFNMLRPKDLIWPYIVNNYMLGKKPFPFDLLFWNQDSTRMTPANHRFYLREFYHENKLARGQLTIGNVKLDLGKVKVPIYELCAKEDHIAPAKSVFIGSRLFGGPVTYVLAGSGHIAGVINPPGEKIKYQYWTNDRKAATLEAWFDGAEEHPGSWWPHYAEWLAKHSGDKVPARTPGAQLGAIEDAPGSYVKVKS